MRFGVVGRYGSTSVERVTLRKLGIYVSGRGASRRNVVRTSKIYRAVVIDAYHIVVYIDSHLTFGNFKFQRAGYRDIIITFYIFVQNNDAIDNITADVFAIAARQAHIQSFPFDQFMDETQPAAVHRAVFLL